MPTVVLFDDPNLIFASAGYRQGGGASSGLSSAGGRIDAKELYWEERLEEQARRHYSRGRLFVRRSRRFRPPLVTDAKSGKVMWNRKDDSEGSGSASMAYADEMLYVRYQNGWVALVKADPKAYQLVSTFRVPNGTGNCSGASRSDWRQAVFARAGYDLVLQRGNEVGQRPVACTLRATGD